MSFKILYVAVLFAAISQGFAVTEIWLEDVDIIVVNNPFFGGTIIIPKPFWDTLESCHVTFPNGTEYEAYPNTNIPSKNVFFMSAVQPFTTCAVGFRGVDAAFNGTYQLASKIRHRSDQSETLTRRRFNVKVIELSQ